MLRFFNSIFLVCLLITAVYLNGCDYTTHRTLSKETVTTDEEPDPDYKISLDYNYQDFISFMFLGNRSETFSTYFNKFYTANEDYEEALKEFKASRIASYNQKLDSVNILTPVLQSTKDKFTKVIERCSKIIQYNKNTKYLDDAVMLIGLSYFYSNDFLQAERKFNEFLSKLSTSDISDEALLYLGMSKLRLRKNADAETILKSLLQNSKSQEVKAEALQVLAVHNIGLKNVSVAIEDLKKSIELTKDRETRAERMLLLGKIYSIYDKKSAPGMYELAFKNTSDFDFEFYAKLNEAKAYNEILKYDQSLEILNKMDRKYLDYPDFKQLVELEIANTDFFQKKYKEAKEKYFYIIVKYPSSKAAAESYYRLGVYYETIMKDYLKALVSYKKSNETSLNYDYAEKSSKKALTLDRYFTIQAVIHDTTKIEIPAEEPEFQLFKKKYEEEQNKELIKPGIDPKSGFEQPKGGGMQGRDTIPEEDSLLKSFEKILEEQKKNEGLDTIPNTKEQPIDTLTENQLKDSIVVPIVNEDSIKAANESNKINAYFELAEIFYYDLNLSDSSIYYLDKIINEYDNSDLESKAAFYLGTIYKSRGDNEKSKQYFEYVIKEYPNSVFANESRNNLGIKVIERDLSSDDSLSSIMDNIVSGNGDRENLVKALYSSVEKDINNPLIPKAYFTLGWVYENLYPNKDSVMKYYGLLLTKYNSSEYATNVKPRYDYYKSLDAKDTAITAPQKGIKDSLLVQDSLKINPEIKADDSLNVTPGDTTIKQEIELKEEKPEQIKEENKEEEKTEEENGENRRKDYNISGINADIKRQKSLFQYNGLQKTGFINIL